MAVEFEYKLNGTFYLESERDDIVVGFDVQFPRFYKTKKLASGASDKISLKLIKSIEGAVTLGLFEKERLVETIEWSEWWNYRCYKLKKDCIGKEKINDEDFEPYYGDFGYIFKRYAKKKSKKCTLKYKKTSIVPVEKGEPSPKTLEEEFLNLSEEELDIRGRGIFHREIVMIDDLFNVIKFNKDDYFDGKRFSAIKFEKEILNYLALKHKVYPYVRFFFYPDGKYYKKIIGPTGIHTGYEFQYVHFEFESKLEY